jgi:hypothetical protein
VKFLSVVIVAATLIVVIPKGIDAIREWAR